MEGGKCYQGDFNRDTEGVSDKMASERCDSYRGKKGVLRKIVPASVDLVVMSEKAK